MGIGNYLQNIGQAVLGRKKPSAAASAANLFRYHSGQNSRNRNNVMPDSRSEDGFWQDDQAVHSARARDQLRNFSVLSWMIDKHLDFNSTFDVQFKTGNDDLDDYLTELFEWWARAENFDTGKRYSLFQYLRVNDAQKVLNGDMGTLKFEDGRVMGIVSDQIENGSGRSENWFRGVQVNPVTMEPLRYRIYARNVRDGGLSNQYIEVPASQLYLHAERKHYPNLIRGISPVANSINSIQDCYEGINWHLVKMKIAAMFGIVTFETKNALPQVRQNDAEVPAGSQAKYDIKLGGGVMSLNMETGERLEVVESKIPSTESQTFYEAVTLIALKSLNIPYSFFREDFTNFYGSRGGLLHYIRSCAAPRQANIEFLNHHIKWRITKWITGGVIRIPKGYDVRRIRWQCIPRGFPWWDPSKEIAGIIAAINAGLMTPQEACLQSGTNYYENIEQISEALNWAKEHNINPIWAQAMLHTPEETETETENEGPSAAKPEKNEKNNGKAYHGTKISTPV